MEDEIDLALSFPKQILKNRLYNPFIFTMVLPNISQETEMD